LRWPGRRAEIFSAEAEKNDERMSLPAAIELS
jgi:hypothetical protein